MRIVWHASAVHHLMPSSTFAVRVCVCATHTSSHLLDSEEAAPVVVHSFALKPGHGSAHRLAAGDGWAASVWGPAKCLPHGARGPVGLE